MEERNWNLKSSAHLHIYGCRIFVFSQRYMSLLFFILKNKYILTWFLLSVLHNKCKVLSENFNVLFVLILNLTMISVSIMEMLLVFV